MKNGWDTVKKGKFPPIKTGDRMSLAHVSWPLSWLKFPKISAVPLFFSCWGR
jgi:hypothetical protein